MVSVGWLGLHYDSVQVHGKDIQFIKLYLANTCMLYFSCVSVFSTDMNSSSLGARPGGFLCRHKLSSQCAPHNHHNLGIRQKIWQNFSEKSILFFF